MSGAKFAITAFITQLEPEEGVKYQVYDDATGEPIVAGYTVKGNPTVGIGRNLAVGLSAAEVNMLCTDDINKCIASLDLHCPWWTLLSPLRQMQLADLCFQLGWAGLSEFDAFLNAMARHNWAAAVVALKESLWWGQVGERGPKIAARILQG